MDQLPCHEVGLDVLKRTDHFHASVVDQVVVVAAPTVKVMEVIRVVP